MVMVSIDTQSPFHRGEREVQARLGVREQAEGLGRRFIRDHLPEQHQAFYAQLPMIFVGSVDQLGRPWASVLVGQSGFISTPDEHTLHINTQPIFGDPLKHNLSVGMQAGLLGIEYQNRRRNRMTGKLTGLHQDGIEIAVDQTFGNCPQYIQARNYTCLPGIDRLGEQRPVQQLTRLNPRARAMLSSADNFYIATHYSENPEDISHGADVSHRGGKPGFVRVEDDRSFTFPDFTGNNHFNTLGNIQMNPRAGLLFIDFDNGDLLYLTCSAEIIWDSEERQAFDGAQRLVRFTLDEGLLVEQAMPIRWEFLEYSPSLEKTGSWEEVAEKVAERAEGNVYRNYQVTQVERESEIISSFYLKPADGENIHCHTAGQFLPIEIQLPGSESSIYRTYTISNAPNAEFYRLTIKKEPPIKAGMPAGLSSNYFHDQIELGSTIRALSPRGKFTLNETSLRPVVLISGGVGITPMISMLEQLAGDSTGCGCNRQVWFIHGARNSQQQAFNKQVRELEQDWPCLNVHYRHSQPLADDVAGVDYDSRGHIDIELLKSLLSFDDYDFYLCGPQVFIESVYTGIKSLNVADERIHYEFFGPGAALHKEKSNGFNKSVKPLGDRKPVKVEFARSGIEAIWDSSKGTLLELAEAEGLQPVYSCRSGVCQTCSCKIISGDVDYAEPPMAEPQLGEALICCSIPQSEQGGHSDVPLVLDL